MYYPQPAVSLAAVALRPSLPALRRHSPHSHSPGASSLLHCRHSSSPPPWLRTRRRTPIAAVSDDFFTVDLDADELESEPESDSGDDGLASPWEGALVYRRDATVHHLEYATTLERLGLGGLSSPDSRARAADLGLGLGLAGGGQDSTAAQSHTPVLVSLDVTRRRGRLRLDGIVRTVITLGCFRLQNAYILSVFRGPGVPSTGNKIYVLRVSAPDGGARRTQGFILVRARRRPYIQRGRRLVLSHTKVLAVGVYKLFERGSES